MRVVVTGGAGFLGSHLCDAIFARGNQAVCLDNLSTGRIDNVYVFDRPGSFTFAETDVSAGSTLTGRWTRSPISPARRPRPTICGFRSRRWPWVAGGRKTPCAWPTQECAVRARFDKRGVR